MNLILRKSNMISKRFAQDMDKAPNADSNTITAEPLTEEEKHLKILEVLSAKPCMSPTEIIVRTGFLIGETRKCLENLVERGFLLMRNYSESIDDKLVVITYEGLSYYKKELEQHKQ